MTIGAGSPSSERKTKKGMGLGTLEGGLWNQERYRTFLTKCLRVWVTMHLIVLVHEWIWRGWYE